MAGMAVAPPLFANELPLGPAAMRDVADRDVKTERLLRHTRDLDFDGIPDARERALARRYAPVLVLAEGEKMLPASVDWLLERLGSRVRSDEAPPRGFHLSRFDGRVPHGSRDARDWKTYVHVYRSKDARRIYVQYWFFYPYDDGAWFFHHEGDWEHATVALDAAGRPLGVYAARHSHNAPGQWRAWRRVRKVGGTHPELLVASGTHACYFDEGDVRWSDRASACRRSDGDCARRRWRTWESGGLVHMGEAHAPLEVFVMRYRGRWGAARAAPGMSSPTGPPYQSGWCVDGDAACTRPRR